jgi:transcriptional regulator with XRE-family HTH domain
MLSRYAPAGFPAGDSRLPDANALGEGSLTATVLDRAIQVLDSLHGETLTRSCSDYNTTELRNSRLILGVKDELKSLGQRVAWARERLGLSQSDLARKAGMSQSAIGNIEAGIRTRPRQLLELAQALNVSQGWLLTGAEITPLRAMQQSPAAYALEGQLSEVERVLIQMFRQVSPPVQQEVMHLLIGELTVGRIKR